MLRNIDTDGLKMLKKAASKLQQSQKHYSGFTIEENEIERIADRLYHLIERIEQP